MPFSLIPALGSPNGRAFAPRGSRGSRGSCSRQSASLVGKSSINWAFEWEMHTVDGCEILHHLGWKPINNGINHVSTGATFLPSTVGSWILHRHVWVPKGTIQIACFSLGCWWEYWHDPPSYPNWKLEPKPTCSLLYPNSTLLAVSYPAIHQPLSTPSSYCWIDASEKFHENEKFEPSKP